MAVHEYGEGRWLVTPGFVDAHTHPRAFDVQVPDPTAEENYGYEGKAGLRQYSEVALRAGFTGMIAMGNETLRLSDPSVSDGTTTTPYPISNRDRGLAMASRISTESVIPAGFMSLLDPQEILVGPDKGRLDLGVAYKRLEELDPFSLGTKVFLAQSFGGFSIPVKYGPHIAGIMHEIHPGKPTVFHVEGPDLNQLLADIKDLPDGKNMAIDIAHVSSKQELEAIRSAKQQGMNVQAEMTPHHGMLDAATGRVVKPDLKTRNDMGYLWRYIKDIDRFGSDNAPHRPTDKREGTPGFANHSFMVPYLLGAVRAGRLTMDDLDKKLSINPRLRFGLPLDDGSRVQLDTRGPERTARYYDERCGVRYAENPLTGLDKEHIWKAPLTGQVATARAYSSWYFAAHGNPEERMNPNYRNLWSTQTLKAS